MREREQAQLIAGVAVGAQGTQQSIKDSLTELSKEK